MRPYRDPGSTLVHREVPDTLECWLRDGDKRRWIRSLYVKLTLTIIVCTFLFRLDVPTAAIPAALFGLLWCYRDIRHRKGAGILLRVSRDRLHVERRSGGEPIELALDELLEVRFDTKSIRKNLTMARADGVNTPFGMDSKYDIGIDVSRIELVTEDDTILLDEEFISHTLCSETLRSIRLFLRKHGWKPSDERPEE